MESKIKRTIAVLLAVCFLMSVTVTAVSAEAADVVLDSFNPGVTSVTIHHDDKGQGAENNGIDGGSFGPEHRSSGEIAEKVTLNFK